MSSAKRRLHTSQSPLEIAVFCSCGWSHVWLYQCKHLTEQERVNTPIWRQRDARKNFPSLLFRITRCWDGPREALWRVECLNQCYYLFVLSRYHPGKLCWMPYWSQWSCALGVLQLWVCTWRYVPLYSVLLRSSHHLAWVADQACGPAFQVRHCLRLPFFGRDITSDLIHPIGHFFYSQIFWPRAVSAFTVPSTPYLSVQRGRHPFQATCLFFSLLLLLPLHNYQYRRTVLTFSGWLVGL